MLWWCSSFERLGPCLAYLLPLALQVALQLAQWMAETGQAAKDEITGGC